MKRWPVRVVVFAVFCAFLSLSVSSSWASGQAINQTTSVLKIETAKTNPIDIYDPRWDIYKNDEYGFSLNYPRGIIVEERANISIDEHSVQPADVWFGGQIHVIVRFPPLPDEVISRNYASAQPITLLENQEGYRLERRNSSVDNPDESISIEYLIRGKGLDYIIIYEPEGSGSDSEAGRRQTFEKMVLTFRSRTNSYSGRAVHKYQAANADAFDFFVDPPNGGTRAPDYASYAAYNYNLSQNAPCYNKPFSQLMHTAEDWFRPVGTRVYAVANGRVIFSQAVGSWGNVVVIEHTLSDNWTNPWNGKIIYSFYGHLSSGSQVSQWSDVSRGQLIGTVMDYPSADHVHFEMRRYGDMTNILKCPTTGNGSFTGPGYTNTNDHPNNYGYTHPSNWIDSHRNGGGGGGTCNPNPGADQVTLFVRAGFDSNGQCVTKNIGEYRDSGSIGLPDNSIRSIKVGGNVRARLCTDNNLSGSCDWFGSDNGDLNGSAVGYGTSSVKVESKPAPTCNPNPGADQVTLFVRAGFDSNGQCVTKNIGEYRDSGSIGLPDNSIRSIKVGGNVRARLCTDNNLSGSCDWFGSDNGDLNGSAVGYGTSSVKVETKPVVVIPGTPSLTSPSNGAIIVEGDSITLTWNSASNATEYFGEVTGGPSNMTFGWQPGTSKNIGTQWPGYKYVWKVKARNSDAEGNYSSGREFTVIPKAPSNTTATAKTCNTVEVTWANNSASLDGFRVYRNGSEVGYVSANITSYTDQGLQEKAAYNYTVKAVRNGITSNAGNTASVTTPPCEIPKPDLVPFTPSGYEFPVVPASIKGTKTSGQLYTRGDTYFDWHFTNVGGSVAPGGFVVEVWVDGTPITRYPQPDFQPGWLGGFDDWATAITSPGTHTVKIIVDPENKVSEANENNNVWEKTFEWKPVNGWWAEFFNNKTLAGDPVLVRDDAEINFDWGSNSPGSGVNPDNFSARWTRKVNFDGGNYRFTVKRDDGARLFIDEQKVWEKWVWDRETVTFDLPITAGEHNLRFEMFEIDGWAQAGLSWVRLNAPPTPSGLAINPTGKPDYTVSWSPAAGAESYQLRERFNSEQWNTVYDGPSQSKYFGSKSPGIWCYLVKATNSNGSSAWSSPVCTTISSPACTAPTLLEPPADAVLSTRTITFSWNPVSGCTFNGYTFRVCTTNNMDNLGSCLKDTGEGGTQRTETITGQDNKDLWWGVKAVNAPNGSTWAVRKFRISPIQDPPTVAFYSPVTSGNVYDVRGETVKLGVSVNASVVKVEFKRWDAVNSVNIPIGTVTQAPFEINLNTAGLNDEWNEIDAYAYNSNGDVATDYIWLNKLIGSCVPGVNGIVLYDEPNYGGACITLTSNDPSLIDNNFNNKTASIRFVGSYRNTGWQVSLFNYRDYKGEVANFRKDTANLRTNPIRNDRATSVRMWQDFDDARAMSFGQTLTGKIDVPSDADTYSFYGSAGQSVSIAMRKQGGSLDSYLILANNNWVALVADDDSGGNNNALIENYFLPRSGTYRITAKSYGFASSGNYTITLSTP